MQTLRLGDSVNLEFDMIGKYVNRYSRFGAGATGIAATGASVIS
jgi:riboflavin synthase alpha subunit